MAEITHKTDPETGHLRQTVSPRRLREILDADGDTHARPDNFSPEDEWNTEDD